jgi:transmembrane sensor
VSVSEGQAVDAGARDPVLARLQPRWSATRTEDNLAVAFRRLERTRRLRGAAAVGALGLGALALAWGWTSRRPADFAASVSASGSASRRLELPDGSTIALGDARVRAVVTGASAERIDVDLGDGPASFDIRPRAARRVVVKTSRFEVTILSAKFDLVPAGARAKVSVSQGEVAASWPGGHAQVKAGETAVLPREGPRELPDEGPPEMLEDAPEAPRARAGTPEPNTRFRALVAHRDYAGAYRSLVAAPGVADHSAEDLMLAADAARLSGHPGAAVPYLRRLLRDHADDVRAPVAAFTLGRVLLSELARPAEAADAFATAYRLAPSGPLAGDALGREVEAAADAGDAARAHRLAETFVARYPNAPRAATVRRAGGLD